MHPLSRAVQRALVSHGAASLIFTLTVLAVLVVASPASAATAPVHLTVRNLNFTSFSCSDPSNPFLCDATATGDVNSNLSTPGTVGYDLAIDWSPGFEAPCNVVDETAIFTFAAGALTTTSHHRDCPATVRPGPRVDTTFTIAGGTGAFAGASGDGTERSSHADQAPVIYHGQIHF
jgi:hypothetical protein